MAEEDKERKEETTRRVYFAHDIAAAAFPDWINQQTAGRSQETRWLAIVACWAYCELWMARCNDQNFVEAAQDLFLPTS